MMADLPAASPARTRTRSRRAGMVERNKLQVAIVVVFLAVWALFVAGNPTVFTGYNIYYAFMSTMPFFGIMALALTYVVTLGEMDLSFPSVLGISSWVFSTVFVATGSVLLALVVCLVVGLAAGLLNGVLVTVIGIPSLVATIGTMFLWRGLVNIAAQGSGISIVEAQDSFLFDLFVGRLYGVLPMQFVWMVAIGLVLGFVYRRHVFGSHVLFVGDNAASAAMMGIRVRRVKLLVFTLMGGFAAFAGVLATLEVSYFWPSQGEGMLLTALAAVFIGGTSVFGGKGTMLGTFLGVLIIGSLEAGIVAIGLTGFWVQFIYGLIITVSVSVYALLLKKQG